jgi:hypothetical protein
MRRSIILALALAIAPLGLSATEVPVNRAPAPAQIAQPMLMQELPHAERIQAPVRAEQQVNAEAAAAVAQPTRTNWWWLVGAIVVAGVIISILT